MQYTTAILTLLALTTSTLSTPIKLPRSQYYGVSVALVVSPGNDPQKVEEPAPVQLNTLTPLDCSNNSTATPCPASELILQNGTASGGLDITKIECRAFKDYAGVVPGSLPFNVSTPALLSTNLASVASLLCYVIE